MYSLILFHVFKFIRLWIFLWSQIFINVFGHICYWIKGRVMWFTVIMNHSNYGVPEGCTKTKHIVIGMHTHRGYLEKPRPLLKTQVNINNKYFMSIFKNILETETCSHHLFVHHLEQIYHKTECHTEHIWEHTEHLPALEIICLVILQFDENRLALPGISGNYKGIQWKSHWTQLCIRYSSVREHCTSSRATWHFWQYLQLG